VDLLLEFGITRDDAKLCERQFTVITLRSATLLTSRCNRSFMYSMEDSLVRVNIFSPV